jgi:hypothetical protein
MSWKGNSMLHDGALISDDDSAAAGVSRLLQWVMYTAAWRQRAIVRRKEEIIRLWRKDVSEIRIESVSLSYAFNGGLPINISWSRAFRFSWDVIKMESIYVHNGPVNEFKVTIKLNNESRNIVATLTTGPWVMNIKATKLERQIYAIEWTHLVGWIFLSSQNKYVVPKQQPSWANINS